MVRISHLDARNTVLRAMVSGPRVSLHTGLFELLDIDLCVLHRVDRGPVRASCGKGSLLLAHAPMALAALAEEDNRGAPAAAPRREAPAAAVDDPAATREEGPVALKIGDAVTFAFPDTSANAVSYTHLTLPTKA